MNTTLPPPTSPGEDMPQGAASPVGGMPQGGGGVTTPLAPPVPTGGHTLYGRILARYDFRLSGGSVWLHDREDPTARDIEVVADPARPGEALWVHSYPNAPFGWCAYGAAAQLWLSTTTFPVGGVPETSRFIGLPLRGEGASVPLDRVAATRHLPGGASALNLPFREDPASAAKQGGRPSFCLPSGPSAPPELGAGGPPANLSLALRAYREMRAMEDAAHLRAACRAEARAHKAASRKWGRKRQI